jgi:1-aminocyclopropane-1-carboxylate deaminase/D-cysteine desulfhydrase-like pyridoxal-dependent ACC family enzyme
MEELESERAELLPSRETLTTCGGYYSHHSSYTSIFANQNGNTVQNGFINVSALNGNLSGNFISGLL